MALINNGVNPQYTQDQVKQWQNSSDYKTIGDKFLEAHRTDNVNAYDGLQNEATQSMAKMFAQPQQSQSQINVYDPTSDINSLKEYQKQQAIAGLDKAKNNSLSGLSQERAGIQPQYFNKRAEESTSSQLGAKNFAEYMASRGQTNAGASIQGELNRGMALQGNIGNLKVAEQGAFDQNARRVTDTNNAYESDVASANAGIEADAMRQLIQAKQNQYAQQLAQANADRQFNYGVGRDTLNDTRYNDTTAYNQSRDTIQDTGKLANGEYTQSGLSNNMNIQVQQAQLREMQDPNSTTNQMAKLGLDTARLNFAALPQQLQTQAQLIAQQLSKGAIDIKTAQLQLNYLPQQLQASINASNRSNTGGGGGSRGSGGDSSKPASQTTIKSTISDAYDLAVSKNQGSKWLAENKNNIINSLEDGAKYFVTLSNRGSVSEKLQNAVKEQAKTRAQNVNMQPM